MRLSSLFFAIIIAFVISAPALAQNHSSTMSVSAVIENNCNVSASPMVFDRTNITGPSSVDGSAVINVNCTAATMFTIDMDQGSNASGNQRRMISDDGRYLDYEIFADAARTDVWSGQGGGVSGQVEGATGQSMIAYGTINTVDLETPSGIYRDTVTVTVSF